VADALVAIGVTSILNFAPRVLTVPSEVLLRYVDLSIELQVMSFYQSRRAEDLADGDPADGVPVLRSVGLSPSSDPG
jgi:redox-sensing transcriptional repressor